MAILLGNTAHVLVGLGKGVGSHVGLVGGEEVVEVLETMKENWNCIAKVCAGGGGGDGWGCRGYG